MALALCPHLRGWADRLAPFPAGHRVLSAIVGGGKTKEDFGIDIPPDRRVVAYLKFAWPLSAIVFK